MKTYNAFISDLHEACKSKKKVREEEELDETISYEVIDNRVRVYPKKKGNITKSEVNSTKEYIQKKFGKKFIFDTHGNDGEKAYMDFISYNKEKIDEVLNPSDPIEKWIEDFIKSDNPKFDGKTKEERRKMALGAYYAAQKK
jgi:hypothetical protein